MPRQLTIDILYDALQEAVKAGLIQDWSVDGMRVVLCQTGEIVELPAIRASAYLEDLTELKEKRLQRAQADIRGELHVQ